MERQRVGRTMSRRRPAVHQSSLSDLPGAFGDTGVRMAKEALRALSTDKSCPETQDVA